MLQEACEEYVSYMEEKNLEIRSVPLEILREFLLEDVEYVRPSDDWVYSENITFEVGAIAYTSHRHKLSFFDGRLDDNNMKDVTTEMISFASLAPLRLRVKSRAQRTEIAVYAGVEYKRIPAMSSKKFAKLLARGGAIFVRPGSASHAIFEREKEGTVYRAPVVRGKRELSPKVCESGVETVGIY